jgi:multicomponent Na+:H+ antiporter subunit E
MRFIVTTLIMFAFWFLLSGFTDAFHLVTGTLSSLFVAWISSDLFLGKDFKLGKALAWFGRFLVYLPWLLMEIVKANLDLVYRTLHPSMPIDPLVITIKPAIKTDVNKTLLANSITLTPGTVTMDVTDEGEFIVHAISKEAAQSLLDGDMSNKVIAVEGKNV